VPLPQVLSIVIVNFNARDGLRRCLNSIYEHLTMDFDIAVIDNASHDGSTDMMWRNFPKVRLLRKRENAGFAAAANFAADAAAGDVILFLSPLCELTHDSLSAPADYLRDHPDTGAVGLRLIDTDGWVVETALTFPNLKACVFSPESPRRGSQHQAMSEPTHVDWVTSTCLMTTRAALDKVGPFDEGFFSGFADVDFCQRVHRHGMRVAYYPEASLIYALPATVSLRNTGTIIAHHRGRWRYYKRYLSNRFLDLPVFVAIWAGCGARVCAAWMGRLPLRRKA
jgi:GT2 family glycosyltransferase